MVRTAAEFGAEQHPAGRIQRDLGLDGKRLPGFRECLLDTGDGSFDLQDVLRGLDQQNVNPALDETGGLLAEHLDQLRIANV